MRSDWTINGPVGFIADQSLTRLQLQDGPAQQEGVGSVEGEALVLADGEADVTGADGSTTLAVAVGVTTGQLVEGGAEVDSEGVGVSLSEGLGVDEEGVVVGELDVAGLEGAEEVCEADAVGVAGFVGRTVGLLGGGVDSGRDGVAVVCGWASGGGTIMSARHSPWRPLLSTGATCTRMLSVLAGQGKVATLPCTLPAR